MSWISLTFITHITTTTTEIVVVMSDQIIIVGIVLQTLVMIVMPISIVGSRIARSTITMETNMINRMMKTIDLLNVIEANTTVHDEILRKTATLVEILNDDDRIDVISKSKGIIKVNNK